MSQPSEPGRLSAESSVTLDGSTRRIHPDDAAELAALRARIAVLESVICEVLACKTMRGVDGIDYLAVPIATPRTPNYLSGRLAALLAPTQEPPKNDRPKIVCLCGSTRFYSAFQEANYRETMAGRIVLSVGFYPHSQDQAHGEDKGCTSEQKVALDELHKRKIDLADEVLVLNVGGYIGNSTRSEIEHAVRTGKPVRYLEPPQ